MLKILVTPAVLMTLLFINKAKAEYANLTSEQLIVAQKQGVIVIDIRTPKEWQQTGTILGSKKIMFFDEKRVPKIVEFMSEFEKVVTSKDQAFILVCRTGTRTKAVSQFLEKQNYIRVSHLAKGMKKWIAEGLDVQK